MLLLEVIQAKTKKKKKKKGEKKKKQYNKGNPTLGKDS